MLTRRTFLGTAAACAVTANAATTAGRRVLREFDYSQVRLTTGPMAEMYRRTQAHFLKLDEDRLLKVYRQRAGMVAPGLDMGGWYDGEGFVPGHLLGQFISGLSRLHACTGDTEAAAKVRRLVAGYGETFERDGKPYASAKASTWACYILDKYEIGLLDAANLAGVDSARGLLPRVIEAATRTIPDHTFDRIGVKNPPYDEPFVLPENLFNTYALTGDSRYLDLAKRYLLDEYFDPLARGENVLPSKHGYSHIIALSSAAKAYEVLGDPKYLRAIRNAWDMLADGQQFASGAWAPQEMFVKPHSGELAASLTATRDHFETPCCFYAHQKLARYLTSFSGESKYGDGLERLLFNTILGALDPDDDGGYFYYSDYQARAHKGYYKQKWPCCAGTLLQSVADYPLGVYFGDGRDICVNLYAGSELNANGVRLVQETDYPASERIVLRVEPEKAQSFGVHLRIPSWLEKQPEVLVNGRKTVVGALPGGWATIRRQWKKGDRIELTLPFTLRREPIDKSQPDLFALMNGPLMMVEVDSPDLRPFYQVQRETYTTYMRAAG